MQIRGEKPALTTTRTYNPADIIASVAVPQRYGYSFKLSDLPGYSEFTNLFDAYRINWVELMFIPDFMNSQANSYVNNHVMVTCADYDDASVPANEAELQQHENCVTRNALKDFKVRIQPRAAQAMFGAGAFTSYAESKAGKWIDCASPAVEHYGYKAVIRTVAGTAFNIKVTARVNVSFKGVR
jgi:hypothetical protein